MARYLVVAHQTAESPELMERLRDLAATDPSLELTLVVPATSICNMFVCDEAETARAADARTRSASARLTNAGFKVVDARVGDEDPIEAIRDELERDPSVQTIVISTLPPGISRWLKLDVLARAERGFPGRRIVPVVAATVAEGVEMPAEVAT